MLFNFILPRSIIFSCNYKDPQIECSKICLPYVPISSSLADKFPKLCITSVKCVNINLKHAQFFSSVCSCVYWNQERTRCSCNPQIASCKVVFFCLHRSPYTQMIVCFQFRFHSGPRYFHI
jgi:hypothetical protein